MRRHITLRSSFSAILSLPSVNYRREMYGCQPPAFTMIKWFLTTKHGIPFRGPRSLSNTLAVMATSTYIGSRFPPLILANGNYRGIHLPTISSDTLIMPRSISHAAERRYRAGKWSKTEAGNQFTISGWTPIRLRERFALRCIIEYIAVEYRSGWIVLVGFRQEILKKFMRLK